MNIRYIADCHFKHFNIMRYDNRPWQDVDSMTWEMIRRWNNEVAKDDIVYILGDVVWSNKYEDWTNILAQLKGHKFVVKGNHDKTNILNYLKEHNYIEGWNYQEVIHDNGRYVVMNHSPMPFFVNMHHNNTYHLYGHVHISFDSQVIKHVRKQIEELYLHEVRMYNVGCMIHGMNYAPRTLDEIIKIDKENRNFEEGHELDYMNLEKEKGQDKIRMK